MQPQQDNPQFNPAHKKKLNTIANAYKQVLDAIGEDINREGLLKTPNRVASAIDYLTSGYNMDIDSIVNGAIFEANIEDMVIVKNIEVYSLCEHHFLPFFGKAHVAYLPNKKIIGISKIPRIVDFFARRLQIQERLTKQIAHAIKTTLSPKGVAIAIEAQHLCMMMRGIEKQNSSMITSAMTGQFRRSAASRVEFLELVNSKG